jgi:hypothetical protein
MHYGRQEYHPWKRGVLCYDWYVVLYVYYYNTFLFFPLILRITSDWSIDRTIDWFSEIIIASVGLYKIGRGYQFIKKEWIMPSRVVERDSNKNVEIDKGNIILEKEVSCAMIDMLCYMYIIIIHFSFFPWY